MKEQEKLEKRIEIQKLIIKEQKTILSSLQTTVDVEYSKLKRMEAKLRELIDDLVDLEKGENNERQNKEEN